MIDVLLSLAALVANACVPQLVAAEPGTNLVMFHGVAPDGRTLALGWDRKESGTMSRGAFLFDLNTGRRTALAHLNNAASFSPNGRFLVAANYASREFKTEIVELDRQTGEARTLASNTALEWLASYSADGRWITFNSTRTGGSDIYRVRRADGAEERVTSDPRYEAHAHYFDHDRQIIFHRQTAGDDYDIIIRDMKTGRERAIGATLAEESYPAVSPNGRWIAFSAVVSPGGQPKLFTMRIDGSQKHQMTVGISKDAYASWAPDGRRIYFVRFDPDGSKIYRVSVRDGLCVAE